MSREKKSETESVTLKIQRIFFSGYDLATSIEIGLGIIYGVRDLRIG